MLLLQIQGESKSSPGYSYRNLTRDSNIHRDRGTIIISNSYLYCSLDPELITSQQHFLHHSLGEE
ncbi:hypothetical protein H5410_029244 [Solanum commersonii]|uniref:Uncharacterized protein n=1 Tax=Solanum commersonii TaxID=4109 RepID=A0A9J5Z741_SOLCO|nr:hypothetical protein H5410_029244 [Solanum commersonii]